MNDNVGSVSRKDDGEARSREMRQLDYTMTHKHGSYRPQVQAMPVPGFHGYKRETVHQERVRKGLVK